MKTAEESTSRLFSITLLSSEIHDAFDPTSNKRLPDIGWMGRRGWNEQVQIQGFLIEGGENAVGLEKDGQVKEYNLFLKGRKFPIKRTECLLGMLEGLPELIVNVRIWMMNPDSNLVINIPFEVFQLIRKDI